jgi:hypothetical protein
VDTALRLAIIVGLVAMILFLFGVLLLCFRNERQTLRSGQKLPEGSPARILLSSGCMLLLMTPVFVLLLSVTSWWYAAMLPLICVSTSIVGQIWRSPHLKLKMGIAIAIVVVNLGAVLTLGVLSVSGDSGEIWRMVISATLGIVAGTAVAVIYKAAVDDAVVANV